MSKYLDITVNVIVPDQPLNFVNRLIITAKNR